MKIECVRCSSQAEIHILLGQRIFSTGSSCAFVCEKDNTAAKRLDDSSSFLKRNVHRISDLDPCRYEEDTSTGPRQAAEDGGKETPAPGSSTARKRGATSTSGTVTVMPIVEPCETTFVTVKIDGTFPLCSPDQQKLPTRAGNRGVQDSVSTPKEHSQFFPTDVEVDACPRRTGETIGVQGSMSTSALDLSDSRITAAAGENDGQNCRGVLETIIAAPGGAHLSTKNSSEDVIGHPSTKKVLVKFGWL